MRLNDFLKNRSVPFIYAASLLWVLLTGVVDYLNGPDVSFLLFYAAPVFVASWYTGRRAGLVVCAASGLSLLAGAHANAGHFSNPLIAYWNASMRAGFMLGAAYLVASFRASLEKERELARTDYLTGAFNGRSFAEAAGAEIERARRHHQPFSVAFMDVDDFKRVNDLHGHTTGDRLLRCVADTVRRNVRAVDTVARLGGDEFAVLMPETGTEAAQVVMRRVRRRLLEAARAEGLPATFSIGLVTWEEPPEDVDEVLRASDELMYSAKRAGKNTLRRVLVAQRPSAAA